MIDLSRNVAATEKRIAALKVQIAAVSRRPAASEAESKVLLSAKMELARLVADLAVLNSVGRHHGTLKADDGGSTDG